MLIDDLLEESKPEGGDDDQFTFTVKSTGRVFTAKRPADVNSLNAIHARAKLLQKRSTTNTPPEWHCHLPISPAVAHGVAFLEKCLVEPKLGTLDALTLAARRGTYFMEIVGEVSSSAMKAQEERDEDEIEDAGNGSGETA